VFGIKIALMYNENTRQEKKMKKLVLILSLIVLTAIFLSNCTTIDQRYTGKRIQVEPAEDYDDYSPRRSYHPRYSYYDPFYDPYYDPFYWTGFSFWNPFWHYGFFGYSFYNYYSPYYRGYYGLYYPYGGSRYYRRSPYYKTYVRKDQLKRSSTARSTRVGRSTGATRTRTATGVKARSMSPRGSATRGRSGSRTTVKRKK
jgi:predicted small secreted protein